MTTIHIGRLVLAVAVLAALDVAGTVALKEASLRRDPALALVGVAMFVALALALYLAIAFGVAELTWVSLGWIIAVQAAVIAVDHVLYDVRFTALQVAALGVALGALVVAALAPTGAPEASPAGAGDHVPAPRPAVDDRHLS